MAATRTLTPPREFITPHEYQKPFLRNEHRYYGFMSGVGAGKTAAGVLRAAANVKKWNPGEMGAIVAPSTQMVKNAIIPVMREFGLMETWEYHGPQAEAPGIHTPNGSRIVVLSADNDKTIERLAALNLAWWWLDEARLTPERVRQILIQRLRKGAYTNGFITSTPNGHDHNYDFFVGDVNTESYAYSEATIYEAEDRLAVTGVPTDANPTLKEQDTQAIREAHPEGLLEQEVEGLFVEIGSGLLTRDMLDFIHVSELNQEREYTYTVTADLGLEADPKKAREHDSDYWAAAITAYDGLNQHAYLVDITRTRGMTKDQGVGWLKGIMETVPTNSVGIEANQAQRWFLEDARAAGLNAYPIENTRNKEERLTYLSVPFANNKVRIVNHDTKDGYDDRWADFVSEWLAFPNGKHDDLLDAVEMNLRQLNFGASIQAYGGNAYGEV